jgi:hypothetical protein
MAGLEPACRAPAAVCLGIWLVARACPQLKQKLACKGFSVAQFGQTRISLFPQLKQNLAPSGFSVWQLGQFIGQSSSISYPTFSNLLGVFVTVELSTEKLTLEIPAMIRHLCTDLPVVDQILYRSVIWVIILLWSTPNQSIGFSYDDCINLTQISNRYPQAYSGSSRPSTRAKDPSYSLSEPHRTYSYSTNEEGSGLFARHGHINRT